MELVLNDYKPAIVSPDRPPVELDLSSFLYYAIDTAKFMNIGNWTDFYDEIPVDPYVKEGYRYKAIGWFRIKHTKAKAIEGIDEHILSINGMSDMPENLSSQYLSSSEPTWYSEETGYCCWRLPQYCMQQSIKYNPVHGDMRREYPGINPAIIESKDFRNLLINYASFFGWDDAIVLVQFQRIDCFASRRGLPAVEGFHQDGNRHVGMLVVGRNNITNDSGLSQYVMDNNGKKTEALIFNAVIPAGQLIYWNDKRVWHYGTELKLADASINNGRGTRDIVILSTKTPPANMPMGPVAPEFRTWQIVK
jgi:hypothetical protein